MSSSNNTTKKIFVLPYWRLSGFYFLLFATVGVLLPYWSLYLKSIGMNASEIGILTSVIVFAKMFITYFWGWIVDHTGRRIQVIQITMLLSAASFSMALFVTSFYGLAILLLVFSVFWSAVLPQTEANTLSHLGEETRKYTRIRIWGSIGFIVSVWGLGYAFETIDIHYVPHLIAGSILLGWLLSLLLPEHQRIHAGESHERISTILLRPEIIALFAVCFLVQASHAPYYTFYSIYLEDNHYSKSIIGELWALAVIAEVVLYLVMHRLLAVFSLKKLLLISLVLTTVRWLMIGFFINNLWLLITAQLLHAASFGSYHAVAIQYIHRYFRGRLQGRGQALYSSISFGAGIVVGTLISGFAWDYYGALVCYLGAAIAAAMAWIITWVWLAE